MNTLLSKKDFGPALADLLADQEPPMSQNKAARLLDVSAARLGDMVRQTGATVETMESCAKAFGRSPAYFKHYRAELVKQAYLQGGAAKAIRVIEQFENK